MESEVVVAGIAILVTLGVAIVGWSKANTANRVASRATEHAERSATAAEASAEEARVANELTRQANERADRAEARATTRNDVRWESQVNGSTWTITNKGLDDAPDVVVILRTGDEPNYQRIEIGLVQSLASAGVLGISDLRQQVAAANAAEIDAMDRAGITYFPSYDIPLRQRILWVDAAGSSHTTEEEEHDIG